MGQFVQDDRKTLVATQVDQLTRRELLRLAKRQDLSPRLGHPPCSDTGDRAGTRRDWRDRS